MIDEWSDDRTGWARFSDDRRNRYRLARALTDAARACEGHSIRIRNNGYGGFTTEESKWPAWRYSPKLKRVVFVMLNPSTADAFKLDPTIKRCRRFAELWGADVLEVVNLFALRSPYPEDLYAGAKAVEDIGAGRGNDGAIIEACSIATRVIAAWGNHGELNGRAAHVRELLDREGVKLEVLGFAKAGAPLHPLARGKSFIPYDREPVLWA